MKLSFNDKDKCSIIVDIAFIYLSMLCSLTFETYALGD